MGLHLQGCVLVSEFLDGGQGREGKFQTHDQEGLCGVGEELSGSEVSCFVK